jgi:hypothetical protein
VWLQEEGYRQLELPTSLCVPTFSKNLGTRENPGLLCDNIIAVKGENMSDGTYWIDPNAGCIHDAIQVFCNSSSEESCIEPTNHTVTMTRWNNIRQRYWRDFVDFVAMPMYSVGIVQMNFLKFFASRTRQRVTLYCNFSTGVKQNKTVRVVGYSEDYRSRLRAEVLLDDCTGPSGKMVLEFRTSQRRLISHFPLTHFKILIPLHYSNTPHLHIQWISGPVCFYTRG